MTLAAEAYPDLQGKMDKLALLGSWDPRGLLDPQGPQVLDVQRDLGLRYFPPPFCGEKTMCIRDCWENQLTERWPNGRDGGDSPTEPSPRAQLHTWYQQVLRNWIWNSHSLSFPRLPKGLEAAGCCTSPESPDQWLRV